MFSNRGPMRHFALISSQGVTDCIPQLNTSARRHFAFQYQGSAEVHAYLSSVASLAITPAPFSAREVQAACGPGRIAPSQQWTQTLKRKKLIHSSLSVALVSPAATNVASLSRQLVVQDTFHLDIRGSLRNFASEDVPR